MILKVTKNKSLGTLFRLNFWNIFWKLQGGFSLIETSVLFFAKLAIFHYIQIKTSLWKNLTEITRGKVWRLIYAFLVFANMSHRSKFWHEYVITYGDFLLTVKPCYNFMKITLQWDLAIFNSWQLPFLYVHYSPF